MPGSKLDIVAFPCPMVVVGGGLVDIELLKLLAERGFAVVAADGGARHCRAADIVPSLVIGDIDSLSDRNWWQARTHIVELSEQETTDFEKCLYLTRAPLTLVLGMTGLRLDHTLAAFDVLGRYGAHRQLLLVDDTDFALTLAGHFSFEVLPGERVSLHPLGPVDFSSSSGLLYPLDGLRLAPGLRTGTSNTAVAGAFSLTLSQTGESGPYLLILPRKYLPEMIALLTAQHNSIAD